jgi:opacity protein-like surface antigen
MSKVNNIGAGLLALLAMLIVTVPASAGSVMMLKGGNFEWMDHTQDTAEYDVRYESRSNVMALGFENRRRTVSTGVEFMAFESDWEAVDPAALRPKGKLEVRTVSFVPRKYFRTASNFYPFIGAGIGWSYVRSTYLTPTGDDIEREDGATFQFNVGGEWRWEGAGLMLELKRIKVDVEDSSLSLSKDDFPDVSGLMGFVGLTMMF